MCEVFAVNERNSADKPTTMAIDEYYYSGRDTEIPKTDSELADGIEETLKPYRDKLYAVYIDPSASSLIQELKKRGLPVKPASNDVTEGIKYVAKVNKSGKYIILTTGAPRLTKERFLYKWDARAAATQGIDKPIKEDDHCSDAERYAIYTHFGNNRSGINTSLSQW